MDFESYARFGVDLVSSQPDELEPVDPLSSLDGLRGFLAPWPWLVRRAEAKDLARWSACAASCGRCSTMPPRVGPPPWSRINHLLTHHRPQPSISGHDDSDWHLHIADDRGPVAKFATGAVMGIHGPPRPPTGSGADLRWGRVHRRVAQPLPALLLRPLRQPANVAAHRERQRSGTV